ncbi:MAG: sigma-54 interaction domain-containing protein [Ignavibacteriales bacterium]
MGIFSPVMRDIIEQAEMLYKRRNVCVLIEGETGTGKELLARYIHYGPLTESINTPFIAINCANLNQLLLESELFGYEPGAFTGGLPKGQIGKVDLAQGGTLFLDEINSLSMEAQSRILRLIEERQFYRVGGHRLITADVRIIAASNVDLLKSIEAHQFRADLYYRLSLAKISVPSLRERKDDILPMANMFLEQATGNPMIVPALTDAAQQALLDYAWPGNCRELKNVITYAAMLQPVGMIDVLHLGPLLTPHAPNSVIAPDQLIDYNLLPHLRLPSAAFNLQEYLDHLTTQLILEALKMQKGNRTRAAEYLGISRSALYRRMHELEM